MLGKKKIRQLALTDAMGWRQRIPEDAFAHKLDRWAAANLKDEDYGDLYAEAGRPSIPPTLIIRAVIYQFHENLSDRAMERESGFSDLAKAALDVNRDYAGLDASTLCRARQRLFGEGAALLAGTVENAKELGILGEEASVAMDSYMVYGAAATQDTYTLLRRAIHKVMLAAGFAEMDGVLRPGLRRDDYGVRQKPRIDWDNPAERRQLLASLVADARHLIEAVEKLEHATEEMRAAAALLARIVAQDIEDAEDGPAIKQEVAKDRVISVTDVEMRHGRKTTATKFDGYKTHIAAAGPGHSLITAVEVTPANGAESETVPSLLRQQEESGIEIKDLLGDTAYGGGDTRAFVAEKGIELVAKVPPATGRKGTFGKEEFVIDLEAMTCRCPAGQMAVKVRRGKDQRGRPVPVFVFATSACASCPMRENCLSGKRWYRTVSLNYHEALLRQGREKQQTVEFKEKYRQRAHVERTICQCTRHGGRQGRFFGLAKNLFQQRIVAVGNNIDVLWRHLKKAGTAGKSTAKASVFVPPREQWAI